jgi:hypothetical protein
MDTASLTRHAPTRLTRFTGLAAGGLGLTLALAAAAPPVPHAPVTNLPGELLSVSAASATDAWAVGTSGDRHALMVHWNGATWTRTAVPVNGSPDLNGVSADSASDAWAVGDGTGAGASVVNVALHWNGTKWVKVPVPSPGMASPVDSLAGVSAAAPNDVWAVGFYRIANGNFIALVLHWNGTAWTRLAVPHPAQADLLGVKALSPSDVWAVGDSLPSQKILVLHWNGTSWSQVAVPGLSGTLFSVNALSPSDAWAVGECCGPNFDQSLVLHWNGTAWTRQPSPSPGGTGQASISRLTGVSALSASDAWAVGYYGHNTAQFLVAKPLVLRWNGSAWTQTATPFFGSASGLDSVQALSPTDAWATGGVFQRDAAGTTVVLHWNGTSWTRS